MATPTNRSSRIAAAACLGLLACAGSIAANPQSEQARAMEGKKLVETSACEACHAGKVAGDGTAMYSRKDRKVSSKAKLAAQVARCNSELNLGLFPDDETAIAAYLNLTYYKFKD
jgi:hypothetical protein